MLITTDLFSCVDFLHWLVSKDDDDGGVCGLLSHMETAVFAKKKKLQWFDSPTHLWLFWKHQSKVCKPGFTEPVAVSALICLLYCSPLKVSACCWYTFHRSHAAGRKWIKRSACDIQFCFYWMKSQMEANADNRALKPSLTETFCIL